MSKLPFVARIFWKVLIVVAALVVLTFVILVKFTDYTRTTTDTVGATITGIIFSYLLHLWMLPAEHLHPDEQDDEGEDEYAEDEGDDEEKPATGGPDAHEPAGDAEQSS